MDLLAKALPWAATLLSALGWLVTWRKLPSENRLTDANADAVVSGILRGYADELKEDIVRLREQIAVLEQRLEGVEEENRALKVKNHTLTLENISLRRRVEVLERDVAHVENKVDDELGN